MRRKCTAMLSLVLSCGCGGLPTHQPPPRETPNEFLLRYKFSPGEELRYLLRTTYSSQALAKDPATMSVSHEAELHQNVTELLPDGRARIAVVIDRLTFAMSGPGLQDVAFDSDDPESVRRCRQEMRGIAFLVGKEVEIHQKSSGEVVGVGGLASIFRQALSELPVNERQPVERLLRDMAYRPGALLGVDVAFPERPIRVGEGWLAEKGPFPIFCGRLAYDCKYLFRQISAGQAIVDFGGELGNGESQPGLDIQQAKKAMVEGRFSFDLERGVLTEMYGESSSFLRVGEREQLRTRTTWELIFRNERCPGATQNTTQTDAEE